MKTAVSVGLCYCSALKTWKMFNLFFEKNIVGKLFFIEFDKTNTSKKHL